MNILIFYLFFTYLGIAIYVAIYRKIIYYTTLIDVVNRFHYMHYERNFKT